MNQKALGLLEFPKIRERVAAQTAFSGGHDLALQLQPSADYDAVVRRHAEVSETRLLLQLRPNFALGGVHDVRSLAEEAKRGAVLLASQLMDVKDTVQGAHRFQRTIEGLYDRLPLLWSRAKVLPDCERVSEEIARCIGPRGEVLDSASPLLASLRRQVRQSYDRLQGELGNLLISQRGKTMLQDPLITLRNGRYVVPVKADFRGEFHGIVQDMSSSGATVFMEPLETIELGNTWRESQLAEEREVERVLREVSALVGDYAEDIIESVGALAQVDLVMAKARYGDLVRGISPRFQKTDPATGSRPYLNLVRARHPLLTGDVVPLTLELGKEFSVLVITGPNTGGKTVGLKTAGLLVFMAQAGIPIPASEGTSLPVYHDVFADIGDEQSIEQSLSTFSSHMSNIITILNGVTPDSLVLLDELGAGTEPAEGSALARAILTHLLEQGASTIVTTHHSDLKAFAHGTPGVRNASMEFNADTLAPTYKLIVGVPGRSNALAIAERLGLNQSLLDEARGMMAPESLRVDELLMQLQQERDTAEQLRHETEEARREANELRDERRAQLERLEDDKESMVAEARERLVRRVIDMEAELKQAGQTIERAIREQRKDDLMAAAVAIKETEKRAINLEKRVVGRKRRRPTDKTEAAARAPSLVPGAIVRLKELGSTAEVVSEPTPDGEVEVLMGSFRAKVRIDQLESAKAPSAAARRQAAVPTYSYAPAPAEVMPMELHLRGLRVEDALGRLEDYLDRAFRAGMPFVRIVHGRGTGVMRQAVRQVLSAHPLVRSYETPQQSEGGEGVTVVHFNQ